MVIFNKEDTELEMLKRNFYGDFGKFVKEFFTFLTQTAKDFKYYNLRRVNDSEYEIMRDSFTIKVLCEAFLTIPQYKIIMILINNVGKNKLKASRKGVIISQSLNYSERQLLNTQNEFKNWIFHSIQEIEKESFSNAA